MGKVWIVDDEEELAQEWAVALRAAGHDVTVCSSFPDALRQLDEPPDIDVAVVDIMMPTFDAGGGLSEADLREIKYGRTAGLQLCRRLRENNHSLPILVATVVEDQEILAAVRSGIAGRVRCLIKPFANERIVRAIGELC